MEELPLVGLKFYQHENTDMNADTNTDTNLDTNTDRNTYAKLT